MFACILLHFLLKQIPKQKLSKYSIFFPLLRNLFIGQCQVMVIILVQY